jgi:general secretion pathway protein K
MTGRRNRGVAGERGFAMIAVLLVLALIGLLGAEFAYSMRLEARAARNYKDTLMAGYLAEAAVQNAVREIAGQAAYVTEAEDGALTFYTRDRTMASSTLAVASPGGVLLPLKRLAREEVPLGDGKYSYRITDEMARLDINNTPPARLDRLLQLMDIEKPQRDTIVDSIQDWRDENGEHRLSGAESDDYYLQLPVPYRARDGNLESINELLQIKGITPELFRGTAERPALADVVTVFGRGNVNINTASKLVLSTLGLSDAEIIEIQATRREIPYFTVPPRFTNRGLAAESRIYRIEAVGLLDGKPHARLTAIVETGGDLNRPQMRVLSWSGVR